MPGALLLSLFVPFAPVLAADLPRVEKQCLIYDAAYENADLFQVKAASATEKVWFHKLRKPSKQKAYLVKGDVVFAGPESEGYRCAYFGTAKGKLIAGFLPASSLEPLPASNDLDGAFLLGTWKNFEDSLVFTQVEGGKIHVEGSASWGSGASTHVGDISETAEVKAAETRFGDDSKDQYACTMTVRRRGPYLVAHDNSNCGGMNVRFNGIYTRAAKPAK